MILANIYYREIQLEHGTEDEFINKCWYAMNMHKIYPNEKIGADAFLDWARDLNWINQSHIIIAIKGKIHVDTRETLELLNEHWEKRLKAAKDSDDRKKVDFIIVEK